MRGAALSFALAAACSSADVRAPEEPPAARSNVLLIIADDQGWADLSCTGLAADAATSNIDRLAAGGVRFTQAYATSPICNASRAGLMTGSYQQRFGTFWYGGKGLHDARFTTLAELLKDAGYRTAYVGKVHYGGGVHVPGNRNFPLEHGFDSFLGFAGGRKHYLVHSAAAEARFQEARTAHDRRGQSLQQGPMWDGDTLADQEGYSTELLGERARAFLRDHARDRSGEPFFMTLSFNAVHNFTHQLPRDYLDRHGLSGWRDWDPAREAYYDWYRAGRYPNNPEGRAHYLGQLSYLDREVGRVLDALEAQDLARDTIVVYVGDNGGSTPIYANNGPLRGSKYTLYEGGIRVPLIVRWPGRVATDRVHDGVVSTMDLLPTICAAAGVPIPAHVDGVDLGPRLGPYVGGEASTVGHETLVWDTGHETAVRRGDWKLKTAKSNAHAQHEMVEVELGTFLYDLRADPGERVDRSAEFPELVRELEEAHRTWRSGLGAFPAVTSAARAAPRDRSAPVPASPSRH